MGLFIAGWIAAPSARADDDLQRFTYSEVHMGMEARITLYATSQAKAEEACIAAFKRIGELDAIMSDYRRDSELNLLCAKAGGEPVPVSADLFRVLERAQQIADRTNGAFDVTASPIIRVWRAARREQRMPDATAMEQARKLVGWKMMRLDRRKRTVRLERAGMLLDLGGIAKGYACDEAQKVLKRHGVTRAMVEMGGDIAVTAPPPGTKGWTIRVPNAGDDSGPKDLLFAHQAISTSGDTEQFVVLNGVRYSHIVDPRTGWATKDRIQVTVVAKEGLLTDPLATVLTLLPEAERNALLRRYSGVKVYLRTAKD